MSIDSSFGYRGDICLVCSCPLVGGELTNDKYCIDHHYHIFYDKNKKLVKLYLVLNNIFIIIRTWNKIETSIYSKMKDGEWLFVTSFNKLLSFEELKKLENNFDKLSMLL